MTDGQLKVYERYLNPTTVGTGGSKTAFELGRNGFPNRYDKTSLAYAAWRAGGVLWKRYSWKASDERNHIGPESR
jgi:hypothetical protein